MALSIQKQNREKGETIAVIPIMKIRSIRRLRSSYTELASQTLMTPSGKSMQRTYWREKLFW